MHGTAPRDYRQTWRRWRRWSRPNAYATTYLSLFVYRNAFEYLRYGYTAAATLVMLVLIAVILVVQWRLIRRYRSSYEISPARGR